jgi:diguanylate cyclase (GGDEF)-like protein/PAS domain S-box-containing protein
MTTVAPSTTRFRELPWAARVYIAAVAGAAAVVLLRQVPFAVADSLLFAMLLVASSLSSAIKVRLPLGASASNLSVSYTVDFASLLLLGPAPTMIVAAVSAFMQSTFRTARRNPVYRVLFSVSALVLTVQGAWWVFTALGGRIAVFDVYLIRPLVAAAFTYYMFNTGLMAAAIGLAARQPVARVWHSSFLWTAPSYFVGAGAAAGAASAWAAGWAWGIPLAVAPVYLTFRSYRIYLDRIAAEQRHHEQILGLHAQAVEALRTARESEQRYALAAAGSNDGLWDWNLPDDQFYASERWKLMLGLAPEAAIARGDDWFVHVHSDDRAELRAALDRHLSGDTPHFEHEYRMRHNDGSVRWMLCRGVAVPDDAGRPIRIAGSQTDVTERRRIQDDLAHAALHDDLTGLANRTLFTAMLERSLGKAKRASVSNCAVLFIDIDHFKLVNDSLGHVAGDHLLVAIAKRFLHLVRPGDVLARLGGDEFAVLIEDASDRTKATAIAVRLLAALDDSFEIDGRELFATASVGIAYGSGVYHRSEDLLRDADTAMYRAKALGRSQYQTFDPTMHASAIQRLTLETQLRRAVERREFILEYQPIVELESSQVTGFEALVRWVRPDGSTTYPSEFIPIAEETGLIAPLSTWVLMEACCRVAEWQRMLSRPLTLTVNISTKLFDRPTLVDEVRGAIAASGLAPGTLRLEITESFLANSTDAVMDRLDKLRAIPVELYLDDFGTGFSSLSYLHRYRLDALKIDQSFIGRMDTFSDSPIVSSIVNLARELGMGVIAEGVETPQQAAQLRALECPHAQGYLFSRPLPAEAAREYLLMREAETPPAETEPRSLRAVH